MRVLYYNWVDYLDDEGRGGGVTMYQQALMQAWGADPEVEALFLSSGLSYDLRRKAPRWEALRHGPALDRAKRFEIVNSGVLAPAHHSFGNAAQLHHAPTRQAFYDFIDAQGPFDVIHFNNLEGLPADVLELKSRFPETRVILSLHNYYPVCPQVNLWQRERAHCGDFEGGASCPGCLPNKHDERLMRIANAIAYHLKSAGIRPGTRVFDILFRQSLRLGGRAARAATWLRGKMRGRPAGAGVAPQVTVQAGAGDFAARRAAMVAGINAHCDLVLCVSDRVRQIAASYGIAPDLLRTSYIGSAHAGKFEQTRPAASVLSDQQTLKLAFLGYMRQDKGFFFLLDALEALPDDLAARIEVLVAARRGPPDAMARLAALRGKLAAVTHVDGYTPDGLDGVLDGTGLGVIPVLWEDNLPQVAIEMHARHIPLLTSDLGGARELGRNPDLVFAAGDTSSFAARLRAVLEGRVDLDAYWAGARAPTTVAAHLASLKRLYAGDLSPD